MDKSVGCKKLPRENAGRSWPGVEVCHPWSTEIAKSRAKNTSGKCFVRQLRTKKGHGKAVRRLAMTSILKRESMTDSRPPERYVQSVSASAITGLNSILSTWPRSETLPSLRVVRCGQSYPGTLVVGLLASKTRTNKNKRTRPVGTPA